MLPWIMKIVFHAQQLAFISFAGLQIDKLQGLSTGKLSEWHSFKQLHAFGVNLLLDPDCR